jgi:hypothetical protein
MADQVTMTWTDATGTYTNSFTIENPTLGDVKAAYSNQFAAMAMGDPGARAVSDEEFYTNLSQRLINDTLSFAQGYKHQQAIAAVPPIEIAEAAPPARSAPKK